jgi:hypothetical protein
MKSRNTPERCRGECSGRVGSKEGRGTTRVVASFLTTEGSDEAQVRAH